MKQKKTSLLLSLISVGFLASVAFAGEARGLILKSGSRIRLEGDSTLHSYSSTATVVNITAAARATTLQEIAWGGKLQSFELSIPVESLKSHSSKMDKNMYATLHAKDYPTIEFKLANLETAGAATGDNHPLKATGSLKIAGRENAVTLSLATHINPEGLRVQGEYRLLMTDYGIKPPSLMLGAIKVADPVTVHFDLLLKAENNAAETIPTTQKGEKP